MFKHVPLTSIICAAVLAGVATSSLAADTIRIALVGPTSGPVAQFGDQHFKGAKMAIERINQAGGVDGKKLEGVVYDDACEPKQAVAVANKVVNDGIRFVIGHVCSSTTQPASDIYEDEGVLMVTALSTSPDITARGYQLVFRTIGLDNIQGTTAGNYIADHMKPKSVAVIHDKQQYGEGIATAVKKALEAKHVKVAMFEGINAGEKDFSTMIAKIKQSGVEIVYYGGYHPELGLLLRQSAEKGLKVRYMGPEGVGNKELSAIAGPAANGLLVTLPKAFDQDPKNQALAEAFKAKNQDPSNPFIFLAYSAVQVVADAIHLSGGEEPVKVAAALRSHTFDTPGGPMAFNEKGDLKDFNFQVYEWSQDGSRKLAE